jgi:CheY-like chemotaxis protein
MPAAPHTVLLVDDSGSVRQILSYALQSVGFSICAEAADGAEAIALARVHRPDLIILDLAMPVMNGLEAAPELRSVLPNTPIILFTLYADVMLTRDAIAVGITSVMAKSDLTALINQATSFFNGSRARTMASA